MGMPDVESECLLNLGGESAIDPHERTSVFVPGWPYASYQIPLGHRQYRALGLRLVLL